MPRRSVKKNKNVYQLSREKARLTRAEASESTDFMSESIIEKIEYNISKPDPEEVLAMAKAYKDPMLCNYYCAHECSIGNKYVPEVKIAELSQIVLQMLASLNSIDKQKERLIDISADGKITNQELKDFKEIRKVINQISITADSLQLWIERKVAAGEIDSRIMD